jgi:hypothetical protein
MSRAAQGMPTYLEAVTPPIVECPRTPSGVRWARLTAELREAIPERSFAMWVEPYLHSHGMRGDVLEIGTSAPIEGGWFIRRYQAVIEACAGRTVRIVRCDRGQLGVSA